MRSKAGPVRLGILPLLVLAGMLLFSASASAATKTFTPEDSGAVFEIPAGVHTVEVEAIGGQGGQAYEHFCHGTETGPEEVKEGVRGDAPESEEIPSECYGEAPLENGGSGARALATLDVSPGEALSVHFGGGGEGSVGPAGSEADYAMNGNGGGGSELLSGTSTPLVVAGGGGGGGGSGRGGNAEGFVGGDGEGEGAGKGGTLSAGGAGGVVVFAGEAGSRGSGGKGSLAAGGGGGYFGGGGGFFLSGGGGAGSSFIAPSATGTVTSGAGLAQQIVITYTALVASCSAGSGKLTLSPGLTDTPAVQTVKIKGTLTGCAGRPFAAASYTATLKTAAAVACSALTESGQTASGAAKLAWTPKAKATKGTLLMLLTEAAGSTLSGQLESGPYSPLALSGTVSERYTNSATCGIPQGRRGVVKAVTKGTFSGSGLGFE
jgi:Glycine rich protein